MLILKSRLDKKKRQRTLLDIRPGDESLRRISDRVSSLFPYLFNFYLFLQDWGLDNGSGGAKGVVVRGSASAPLHYTHKMAFQNQKDLYNSVQ